MANIIYIYIYGVLVWCCVAIKAPNQGIICSCMIFQPSCFILYFNFSMNLVVFYEIFYKDVTTLLCRHSFLTDPNEICTAYVKLEIKNILFLRIFDFRYIYLENYDLFRKLRRLCNYPTPLPPSSLGRSLGWVLLRPHLSHT